MSSKYPSQVQWDGDEPYLPLTPELRLTPTRTGDVQDMVELMNTEPISAHNWSTAKPYTTEMAEKNVNTTMATEAPIIAALHSNPDLVVAGSPFSFIREISTGRPVGYCRLSKVTDYLVPPSSESKLRLPYEPAPLPSGGSAISDTDAPEWAEENWNIGYGIHPDWSGKGITTKVVKVIIEGWVIPHMRLKSMSAGSAWYNGASHHILRKSGFHQVYGYWRTNWKGEEFDALKFHRNL